MILLCFSRRSSYAVVFVLVAAAALVLTSRTIRAGQDTQQGQQQPAQTDQTQGQQQEKPKKKGGFFGGLKAATGATQEQKSDTASAGTKGVGEGAKIGDVAPTAADRQAVTQMENYSVAQGDLSKFIEAGHLKAKQ